MSKTIEISMELAERLTSKASCIRRESMKELRTLLAAPAVERQEPVAWLINDEKGKFVECINYPPAPCDLMGYWPEPLPLYTSPPVPVAVVLPARWQQRYEADCDASETGSAPWSADSYMQDEIRELRACLDKIKELNQ